MATSFLMTVAPGDRLPLYQQIVEQVKAAIASRLIVSGERLPSHRELATQLRIAPLTVKRAYDVLEGEGLVATRRGRGTFVAASAALAAPEADAELEARLQALIRQARALGWSERRIVAALRAAWRRHVGDAAARPGGRRVTAR